MCPLHSKRLSVMNRRGFSLAELLIAVAIMAVLAGAVGALAISVESGSAFSQGRAMATQHARVARDRIERTVREATANEQFPGFFVLTERIGSTKLPDTLVVWRPAGSPANPQGMPLMSELVVFTPDKNSPNRLLEVRAPGANRPAPAVAFSFSGFSTTRIRASRSRYPAPYRTHAITSLAADS